MYKTFLQVQPDDVIKAVEECRNSVASSRVAAYQVALDRQNERDAPVAVIIQRMVQPQYAGVCFTVNPVTGDTREVVIEAVAGLGERLVSGQVTPECYRLLIENGQLVGFEAGEDTVNDIPLLTEKHLQLLWREAKRLSAAFGKPLDIEYAFVSGDLYMLQARPITSIC